MGQLLLVRHGQASFGDDDYDALSETGWEQSRMLGKALAARGIVPDVVVTGSMRRHRETAEACVAELAVSPTTEVDAGWNEFDHTSLLSRQPATFEGDEPSRAEFQEWYESATDRWTGGKYDDEYDETFGDFTERIGTSLGSAAALGAGTALVFSSGGPIAWVSADLLASGREVAIDLWKRLNPICVNSGVTRLVSGRRGITLITFNGYAHLDAVPGTLTYR